MSEEQKANREEAKRIATMVVAGLQSDQEIRFCERTDKLTNRSPDATKVTLVLVSGEQYTFSVVPTRERPKKPTTKK